LSSETLTTLSYTILGLVGRNGASTPELVDGARRGAPLIWAGAESQIYSEARRLASLGYLETEKQPAKTRSRTFYRLTERGRETLMGWLGTPAPFPRIQHEAAIRLLAADFVPDETTLAALRPLRGEIERREALLAESEAAAHGLPHRERYLLLQLSLVRRLLRAHRDWLDELERELGE